MSKKKPTDLPASIRQRLLNLANERGEELQNVLARYGIERLLYRIGQSDARDRFVLKGAVLFYLWDGELHRPTRDVDFLAQGDLSPDAMVGALRVVCAIAADDGLAFLVDTIRVEPIRGAHAYAGLRVSLVAMLGTARIPLRIDFGFGDAVTPRAELATFPTMLGSLAPVIRVYPPRFAYGIGLASFISWRAK
ncbi:MAG: nucleotidyl transferase AbiEii/AbiGii toxin family protein [Gemmatimonadota bacterium]|nr:nucleotidyl transferase AbiEii/AbiGii toxin family protein [Gemmatimonadota bacterium]